MRKIMLIVIAVLLVLIFHIIQRGSFLKFENKYIIINENGKIIPAKIYSRTVQSKINDKEESIYEILIFFDDNQGMKSYNPILVIPKYNMIGIVDGGKREFLFFGNSVFQRSEKSNKFTSLTNSLIFDDKPPVNKIVFKDSEIIFNSFEGLKRYGKNLTLKF